MKRILAPINKAIRPWVVATVTLVIACAAFAYGYLSERNAADANRRSAQTVACINNILGSRQPATADDSDALLQWAISLGAVLAAPSGSAEQESQYEEFQKVDLPNLIKVYTTDKAFRTAHPLGKC